MKPTSIAFLKKWRWLIILPPILIFAALFAHQTWSIFGLTTLILYLIGLLFAYSKSTWLLFFVLSLAPTFTSSLILQIHRLFSHLDIILFLLVFLFSLIFSYYFARKKEIIPAPSRKSFPLLKIFIGFLLLLGFSYLLSFVGQATHTSTTENQAALDQLQKSIPFFIFGLQTVFAGFFEELTYRASIFELVLKKFPALAFIVAALLFTVMHGPSDLYSWLLYGCMSLILTTFYAKYRNFYLNMSIHMLWNFVGILAAFFLR